MSDWQQSPDWWRASDGRWYPPAYRPDAEWNRVRPSKWTMRARAGFVAGLILVGGAAASLEGAVATEQAGCQITLNDAGRFVNECAGSAWSSVGVVLLVLGALVGIVAFILPAR